MNVVKIYRKERKIIKIYRNVKKIIKMAN
jgi:hypothetical protein